MKRIAELQQTASRPVNLIVSSQRGSAAFNRNWCLDRCLSEVAIMLDDDVYGFYPGWDSDLVQPLLDDLSVCMVSARLLTPDGRFAPTCSRCYDDTPDVIEVKPSNECVIPTAAIAFRNIGIRFDERFKGSGWEDNDWCFQYLRHNPNYRFIQSNKCRLIHDNEQKDQSDHWTYNREYFKWKWTDATGHID